MLGDSCAANATYGRMREWDVRAVRNMSHAFDGRALFDGDLSAWNVGAVTNFDAMFKCATSYFGIGGIETAWDVKNKATSM